MNVNRRQALSFSLGATAFAIAGFPAGKAFATPEDVAKSIADFAGGAEPKAGKLTLTAPEIAENGNTVPVSVSVDSAMTEGDMVDEIAIFSEGNPLPDVITFHFTPLSGKAEATTRMRLAKTQNVVAVAKMADGTVYMDKKMVKVTIGGCGG